MTIGPASRLVRIRFARVAALIALAAGAPVAPARAQSPASSQAWLAAVRAHAPGAIDDAVVTVLGWPAGVALATVRKSLRTTTDPVLLQRALLLHTDAAIAERAALEAGGRLRRGGGAVLDGRAIGDLPPSHHWKVGRVIAESLLARPGGRAIVQRWYRASSALMQEWADCGGLRPHLEAALRALPDDPVLLLDDATMHQTFADPRVQLYAKDQAVPRGDANQGGGRGMRRDAAGRLVETSIGSAPTIDSDGISRMFTVNVGFATDELGRAERALRRAIELDASLVEARIRLAHVLAARGQFADALPLAEAALASPLPPFLKYYAAMVLGWSADALHRPADARRAFERAAAVFPLAQSARIAISRLAVADSRAAQGLAAIVAASGPQAARDTGDPWWSYFRVHDPDSKALIAALRGQLR